MASTYRPVDALDYVKAMCSFTNIDTPFAREHILDDVNKYMWMYAPWRWTIGSFPLVTLVASTTDYTVSVPADFLYLIYSYITDGTNPDRILKIEPSLPTTVGIVGQPTKVCIVPATPLTTLRVSPKPGTSLPTTQVITSLYKITAPAISHETMYTAGVQIFDDEWFWVYQEGCLWKAYLYAHDFNKAGGVITDGNGKQQYTGQYGSFIAALEMMASREKIPTFDDRNTLDPPSIKR